VRRQSARRKSVQQTGAFLSSPEVPFKTLNDSAAFDLLWPNSRVDDTMIVETLRRYRLGHIAEIFELSKEEFEALAEAGKKILFPDHKRTG
jgi:hypothetical protein